MKQMEEEDEKEQEELRSRINQLEADVENYNHLLVSWRERYQKLELDFSKEQQLRKNAENELHLLRSPQTSSTDAVPLPPRTIKDYTRINASGTQDSLQSPEPFSKDVPMGCGKCSKDTRCECMEVLAAMSCAKCTKDSHCECIAQALEMSNILPDVSSTSYKRSHSPFSTTDSKRSRYTTSTEAETEATEIDFTTQISAHQPSTLTTTTSTSSMPAPAMPDDSCGFCTDGTPCICAEMAADAAKKQDPYQKTQPAFSQTSSTNLTSNTCINGPGTCAQCQSSSSSTLFCKSLAATRPLPTSQLPPSTNFTLENPTSSHAGPSNFPSNPTAAPTTQAITGPTLSCADAYRTLSRHPAFDQASQELGAWIPELKTIPGGSASVNGQSGREERIMEGLTAFEVEAASVMGVLKFFDRRFGRG